MMLNKDFYKLRRDFNPRVVPSVDFIPVPDVPGETVPEFNMPYPDPFGGELPLDTVKANPRRGSSTDKKEAFQDFLNRGGSQLVAQAPSQPALDADGKPMEGTSMGVPIFGGAIPGTMVGNMQGVLTGYPQLQTNTMFGPVTPGTFAGKQLYPLLIPRR